MKKPSFIRPNRTPDAAEIFAALCVLIIFMTCLIGCHVVLIRIRELAPLKSPVSWRAAGEIASSFSALIISWFMSVHIGNWLVSKFMGQKLKSAISVMPVMRALGLSSVKALSNFAKLHNISVYRVKKEMGASEEELPCRRVPLFSTWLYSPILKRQFFADNLLYLDKEEVQPIIANMAGSLAKEWPETVCAAVNAEQEKQIQILQKRLTETTQKLEEKNRSEGPYATTSKHKLFLIAQLFTCFLLLDVLKTKKAASAKLTKSQLNAEYTTFITERESLADLLSLLKPDASREALHPEVLDLFRLSMKPGTVAWGGSTNKNLLEIIKKVMSDTERASFDDTHGWILK